MFKFLKDTLRKGISKVSEALGKKAEEPPKQVSVKAIPAKPASEMPVEAPINQGPAKPLHEQIAAKPVQQPRELPAKPAAQPKGIFQSLAEKVTTTTISDAKFDDLFWPLEEGMLESNVAVEVIEKIKGDLKGELIGVPLKRGDVQKIIETSFGKAVKDVLSIDSFSLIDKVKAKKPSVICFVGINGSGKTTSIAKIAHLLQQNGLSVVLSASDTFRAASIEQLQHHGDKLGIRVIKHTYKSDPAAVAFDAISHAKSRHIDAVLIDTAGRMHSNTNLMDELKKVVKVAKPDITLFVGESITGNDCIEQAKTFNEAIGIDAIILAKADIDEKGGAALSVSYVTQKPILYLGTGQEYDDLVQFKPEDIVRQLGLA
ncbi:MAG TPA: signal recognition particle-docking protein FtsY [Candidatus Nanoarchaeia archaeon]|nr:signal recognition particle-docking protein FtsY [Candidatus Nanoarchaeia archaeon]